MQLCFQDSKFTLPALHVLKLCGKKCRRVLTGCFAGLTDVDDAGDLSERQACRLSRPNEGQARFSRIVISAIPIAGSSQSGV